MDSYIIIVCWYISSSPWSPLWQHKMARPDQQPQSQSDEPHAQTQIQLSESYQTEDHSQVEIVNHSESQVTNQTPISTVQVLAIVSLTIRAATWICLLASLIVLASDTSTIKGLYRDVKIGFNDIYSYRYLSFSSKVKFWLMISQVLGLFLFLYTNTHTHTRRYNYDLITIYIDFRYMMSAIVIGFTYTCVQLPIEIYQLSMGKRVTIGNGLPMIIFFGDKVIVIYFRFQMLHVRIFCLILMIYHLALRLVKVMPQWTY